MYLRMNYSIVYFAGRLHPLLTIYNPYHGLFCWWGALRLQKVVPRGRSPGSCLTKSRLSIGRASSEECVSRRGLQGTSRFLKMSLRSIKPRGLHGRSCLRRLSKLVGKRTDWSAGVECSSLLQTVVGSHSNHSPPHTQTPQGAVYQGGSVGEIA